MACTPLQHPSIHSRMHPSIHPVIYILPRYYGSTAGLLSVCVCVPMCFVSRFSSHAVPFSLPSSFPLPPRVHVSLFLDSAELMETPEFPLFAIDNSSYPIEAGAAQVSRDVHSFSSYRQLAFRCSLIDCERVAKWMRNRPSLIRQTNRVLTVSTKRSSAHYYWVIPYF